MILELINNNLETIVAVLGTIITAFIGFLTNKFRNYINDDIKKEIVNSTVKYVEQVFKTLGSEEKLAKAKEKAAEWLNSKGINISETELEILIESAVREFTQK